MSKKVMAAVMAVGISSGCSSNRGGIVDRVLDTQLYQAETKAERLLRHFEIQGLLIRYAASFGTSGAKETIATTNAMATARFKEIYQCLQSGSAAKGAAGKTTGDEGLDGNAMQAYCSFFDSKMMDYENVLLTMLRQAVPYDDEIQKLKKLLFGVDPLDLLTILTDLLRIAERLVQDERVLNAFKADVRELQYIAYHQITREALAHDGPSPDGVGGSVALVDPQRAKSRDLKEELKAAHATSPHPAIKVWHFREVAVFIRNSCVQLNQNAIVLEKVTCSTGLPFGLDTPGTKP